MPETLPKIIAIVGPTGSGKSNLAVLLAKKFNGEIIVADARQIYKKMKIGTNSPTTKEQKDVLHHLCNFLEPSEKFNVAQFQKRANMVISDILERKKLPILVGGTGLYIKAVIDNFDFAQTQPNEKLREKLEGQTLEELLEKVDQLPNASLAISDRKNKRRVVRALEIGLVPHHKKSKKKPLYDVLQIGPTVERADLYGRINVRVVKMMKNGLEKEVRELLKEYSWDTQAMSGIGYREFRKYFAKEISYETLISEIQKDTRRYAKRQLTWFTADKRIHWVNSEHEAGRLVQNFLG